MIYGGASHVFQQLCTMSTVLTRSIPGDSFIHSLPCTNTWGGFFFVVWQVKATWYEAVFGGGLASQRHGTHPHASTCVTESQMAWIVT